MSMNINIRFEGMEHVDRFVNRVAPEAVELAGRRAINRVINKTRTRTVRGVSAASGVKPIKIIKTRVKLWLAKHNRQSGGIIFSWSPLPAEALGEVKWSPNMPGARAGRKSFPGTFAAQPKKGKHTNRRRVYTRVSDTGVPRADLHASYILMEKFKNIPVVVGNRVAAQDLLKEFGSQLALALRKGGFIR